jgi:dynein heavy chain
MQATTADSGGTGVNKEEFVANTASDILAKMPPPFDVVALRKEAGEELQPTTVVLFQELERYTNLIERMTGSLHNLKRALKGEIGMSSELDDLSFALFNGFLPGIIHKNSFLIL